MGAISFTLDTNLVHELRRLLPLTHFVETGTFRGESLEVARSLFEQCLSIELSGEHYRAALRRFAGVTNVRLVHGDSAHALREHRTVYANAAALFWLDAHWCAAEGTAGEKSQCPLLGELAAIGRLNEHSVVLIDDARLFLSSPPRPHEISTWPELDAVLRQLRQLSEDHALACFNDVLIFAPAATMAQLRSFLHEHTVNLLTLADKARDYDFLLAQAKAKDLELVDKEREIGDKEREIGEKEAEIGSKEKEITQLHTAAKERLDAVLQLDQEVTRLRQVLAAAQPGAGPDARQTPAEAVSLQLQARLTETRRRLQAAEALAVRQGRELQALKPRHHSGKPSLTGTWLMRWSARLAAQTAAPLGKLRQHPPRPLQLEKFPSPPRLRQWPRICLITPSYQQAGFLERTMRSVLEQKYPNLAYGVQDGGSTDGSAAIIERHVPQLAHAESAPDKGQSDAIHRGFAKLYPTTHDIMGWVNSDDVLMPGALHYVGAYFARHPEVDVVYGHRVVIDDEDREVGRWYLPRHHANTLKWFDLVPQETLFWRAHCYQEVGGVDPSFHFAMDWDLLLRFEQACFTIRRLPFFLGCFRVHEEQKTTAKIQTVGEKEMDTLRRRTHDRAVPSWEVHQHLAEDVRRSAVVERLHRFGLRF